MIRVITRQEDQKILARFHLNKKKLKILWVFQNGKQKYYGKVHGRKLKWYYGVNIELISEE